MENVTKKFLESKKFEHNVGWGAGVIEIKSSSGNLNRLSENVFYFTEYNFLPTDGSELDGHYTLYVNYKTFNYLVFKHSEYGSLTYTLPTEEKNIIELNKIDKKIIEATIASKLLNSYFYEGENLIPSNEIVEHKEYLDRYRKNCLITDYRNYIWSDFKPQLKSDTEYLVLSLIENDFTKQEITDVSFSNLVRKENCYKFEINFFSNGIKKELSIIRTSTFAGISINFVNISKNTIILRNDVSIKNLKVFKENLNDCLKMLCENNLL